MSAAIFKQLEELGVKVCVKTKKGDLLQLLQQSDVQAVGDSAQVAEAADVDAAPAGSSRELSLTLRLSLQVLPSNGAALQALAYLATRQKQALQTLMLCVTRGG